MPATTYIVTAQIGLIAASAVLVNLDWKKGQTKRSGLGTSVPSVEISPPVPTVPARPLPPTEISRFALIEQEEAETTVESGQTDRPMGFGGQNSKGHPGSSFTGTKAPTAAKQAPVGAAIESPPEFDPVPENVGYHILADAATNFDLNSRTIVFSGHVSLKCSEFAMSAERLVVHMDSKQQTLKKLVANGKVDIHLTGVPEQERFRGQSEEAVFDPATGGITLSGWPRIQGQGREHQASTPTTKMTLYTMHPRLATEGRAQTRLLMGKDGLPGVTMSSPSH